MRLMLAIVLISFFASCNNSASGDNKTVKTKADSVMDEVMERHNMAMGKMDHVAEMEKTVQQAIDSINKLPATAQKNLSQEKAGLSSVLDRLKKANENMDRWMDEFKMDSLQNDVDNRVKYLESEKVKVSSVKDEMTNSLQQADSMLKKK